MEAGDHGVVDAIDCLGDEAVSIYRKARQAIRRRSEAA